MPGSARSALADLLEGVETGRPDPLREAHDAAAARRSTERAGLAGPGSALFPAHEPHGAIPSIAAIAGHPLHPAIVPLPIGSFVGALACDVAFAATGDRFFARASRLLTGGALVTGLAAGALGALDFVGRPAIRSHPAAWVHAGGNVVALGLGLASLAARGMRGDDRRGIVPAGLALNAAAGGVLLVTAWLGGELAFRHRVGVTDREDAGSTGDGVSLGWMT
jgi:uncharacterized membrane protein